MGKAFIRTVSYVHKEEVLELYVVQAWRLYGECQHSDAWALIALIQCGEEPKRYVMVYPRDDGTFEIIDERWGYFLPEPEIDMLRRDGHLLPAPAKKVAVMKTLKMLVEAM